MTFSNLTDRSFWDAKYKPKKTPYHLYDPYYGKKGLLSKTLLPWLNGAENVFEIGCGSSRYLMFFNLIAGLKTYGIDFSIEGLQSLKLMAKKSGVNHNLYFGDMFADEISKKKFDVVFHSGLVEHFSNIDLFFERCRFFCKNDGLMIFLMPNMQNFAWRWHKKLCPSNYKAHIPYTKKDIISAASKYFDFFVARPWGYPQLYAGGPPESILAKLLKHLNIALSLWISCTIFGYKGTVDRALASTWLFICKPR